MCKRNSFSSTMEKVLNERFSELSKTTEIPQSRLLDEAIGLLLQRYSQGFNEVSEIWDTDNRPENATQMTDEEEEEALLAKLDEQF